MNVLARSRARIANLQGQQRPAGSWYRIVRNDAAGAPTRVDVYDDIGGGGGWFEPTGVTAQSFVAQLAQIEGDLEVHINSAGGDVFDGLAIFNAIASRPGNVTTVVDGIAASIASVIAQAGTTRIIAPGAMMMIHDALSMCIGNASDMRETADLLDQVSDNLASVYALRGGDPAVWRAAMQAESWYTAQQAVDAGLADRLAERPAAPDAVADHDWTMFARVPRWLRAAEGTQDRGRRVLGIESMPLADKAIAVHHTATVEKTWDGPAVVAAMPAEYADLHYCHAWQSADADASSHTPGDDDADDKKKNFKFPHHDGEGTPANVAACRNGLARLEGADIPDADRAGVRAHLQAHLDDATKKGAADNHMHVHVSGMTPERLRQALKEAFE